MYRANLATVDSAPELAITGPTSPVNADQSFTLTVTTSLAATAEHPISIIDLTSGSLLKACTSGTSCSVSTHFASMEAEQYIARQGQTETAPFTVVPTPWSLTLTTTKQLVATGESASLDLILSQSPADVSSMWGVRVVDAESGEVLNSCDSISQVSAGGYRCRSTIGWEPEPSHTYRGELYDKATGGTLVYSNETIVASKPWVVSIETDRSQITPDGKAAVTIHANQQISSIRSDYIIHLVNEASGNEVSTCASLSQSGADFTCTVSVGALPGTTPQLYAVVASRADYAAGVLAESNRLPLSVDEWSVRLEVDKPLVKALETYNVTAYVDGVVSQGTPPQRLYILDRTTGAVVKSCDSGYSTGTGELRCPFQTGGDPAIRTHEYVAVIASREGPDVGVTATSNAVKAEPMPWQVVWSSLRPVGSVADASGDASIDLGAAGSSDGPDGSPLTAILTGPPRGYSGRFTALSSQSPFATRGNYALYVQDVDSGEILNTCTGSAYDKAGTQCSGTISFDENLHVRRVQAFVAPADDPGGERLAETSVEYVMRARVDAALLGTSVWCHNGKGGLGFYGGSNYFVKDTSYRPILYGPGAEDPGYYSGYTTYNFSASYGSCSSLPQGGYFYQIEGYRNGMTDTIATSNVVFYPGGLGQTEQAAGGNASEQCVQACAGDPVNTATGEFFEVDTDLSLPGVGPTLSWGRSYSTAFSSVDGDMGYGWRSGSEMRVDVLAGSAIADAEYVRVTQENGAPVVFARGPGGAWVAPDQVFAELRDTPDGGVTFVRRDKELFDFAADGSLQAVRDRNGNSIDFSYQGGRVVRIDSGDGRWISIARDASGRVTAATDSAGREIMYSYSAAGDLVAVETGAGNRADYGYDSAHRLTSLQPPATGATRNEYDSQSRVVRQTAPDGGVTRFSYGASSTTITNPDGSVVFEQYDKSRLVARTTAYGTELAATTQFTYTTRYQVASTVDPSGRVTTFVYDANGNLRQVVNSRDEVSTYDYDESNNLVRVRNALGETAAFEYDARGNVTAVTDALGNRFTYVVDSSGRRVNTTDPLGHTGSTTYDQYSNPTTTTSPGGLVTQVSADQLGRMLMTWDPRAWLPGANPDDFATAYTYNDLGLLETVTDAAGAVVSMDYDAGGRLVSTTDAHGRTARVTYDQMGRPVTQTDALGQVVAYEYDAMSRVVSVSRPGGATTQLSYDALGRLDTVTDAEGGVTRYAYNKADQRTSVTDPDGRVTAYAYDASGRLASTTDAGGGVTSYVTDALGRVTQATDPMGRATTFSYDALGRLVATEYPDSSEATTSYDPLGRVLSSTDTQGRVATYSYDPDGSVTHAVDVLGRVTDSEYSAGYLVRQIAPDGALFDLGYDTRGNAVQASVNGLPVRSSVVDLAGRVASTTEGAGQTTYAYDALDRVVEVNGPTGDVRYAYDELGAISSVTYPSGREVERGHDLLGRLTSVSTPDVGTVSYSWSPGGLLQGVDLPNGVDTDYGYDAAGRLSSVDVAGGGTSVLGLLYTYDSSGRLTGRSAERPGLPVDDESFATDALGRVSPAGVSGPMVGFTPSHEPTTLPDGTVVSSDEAGVPQALVAQSGITQFVYDVAGRRVTESMAGAPVRAFSWDPLGQLTSVEDPAAGVDVTFSYASGLRVGASQSTTSGVVESTYSWQTASAVPLLLSDDRFDYVYGTGTSPVAQVDVGTGEVTYLHGDVVGSTRTVTNADGDVVAQYDYGMYGDLSVRSGSASATSFLFAGEYRDPAGMYYLRHREYDPGSGVFLSVDPILSVTGMPYAYTAGNPFQGTDPLGLFGLGDAWDGITSFGHAVWEEVTSPEFIVSTVVGVACVVAFGPAGVVGCAAASSAVYSAIDYSLNTPAECQSLGDYFWTVVDGAGTGAVFAYLAGPVAQPLARVVSGALRPLVPAVLRESVSSMMGSARGALQRTATAIRSRLPGLRQAVESAGGAKTAPSLRSLAAEIREAGLHPAARNNRTVAVGLDDEGNLFAGSSNGFDAGQRAALERLGITRVPGSGSLHAEEELLRGVPGLQSVATSVRPPCGASEHNCLLQLIERGVEIE